MSGGITVNDDFRPANGSYAVDDLYVRGGFKVVADIAALNAIVTSNSNLKLGQRVYVVSIDVEYKLTSFTPGGGFSNGTWVVYAAPTNAGSWTGVDTVATSNVTKSGEQTLHGLLTSHSRVLLTGQTNPAENGPWVTAAGAWARAVDADTAGEFAIGKIVAVTNAGSDLYGTIWTCTSAVTTLGTDPISFVENAASGTSFNPHAPGPFGDSTPAAVYATEFTRAPQIVTSSKTMDNYDTWLVDTTGGTFTLKFPAPINGRCRLIKDKGKALATTAFTLDGDGNNFESPFSLASVASVSIGGGGTGAGNGWAGEWMWSATANLWVMIR